MRRANIYYKEVIAGILTETDDGDYVFQYDEKYIAEHPKESISLTMPVSNKPYTDKRLFPFFEGLIPEGWLLDIAHRETFTNNAVWNFLEPNNSLFSNILYNKCRNLLKM